MKPGNRPTVIQMRPVLTLPGHSAASVIWDILEMDITAQVHQADLLLVKAKAKAKQSNIRSRKIYI